MKQTSIIKAGNIDQRIFLIRGKRVMIDRDIAVLYGVETKQLNRQVKRNITRFPDEFMFQLNITEKQELVTNWHRFESLKHSTSLPYAFTEHGVAMLSAVLNSKRAISMSVQIIKAFVRLREYLLLHTELAKRISELERRIETQDEHIKSIFEAIHQLITPPGKPKRHIGFKVEEPKAIYMPRKKVSR